MSSSSAAMSEGGTSFSGYCSARSSTSSAEESRLPHDAAANILQDVLTRVSRGEQNVMLPLAEATAVADQLRERIPGPVADTISAGAREASLAPMSQAYIVLGSIAVVGSLVLAVWTPTRMPAAQDAAPIDTGTPTPRRN